MDLMTYRDAPCTQTAGLFPARREVQAYLEYYATEHDLRSHIRFNTTVTSVKKDRGGTHWHLTSQTSGAASARAETFSHILVCHGRCSTPHIPNIDGLDSFSGTMMHSAWYRDPKALTQQGDVLVVGNGSSGMDIARELVGSVRRDLPSGYTPKEWEDCCREAPCHVYSSWHSPDKPPPMDFDPRDTDSPEWSRKIQVVDQIDHIDGNSIHFADGTVLDSIKVIVFATGFLFDNAFIDQSTEPLLSRPLLPPSSSTGLRTGMPSLHLYNLDDWQLFHATDETIAFLGVPSRVVPFPFTEAQACFVISRWTNMVSKLPRLDPGIPPDDANRWSSRRTEMEEEEAVGKALETTTHVFGHPSDSAYIDALMAFLKPVYPDAGTEPPWQNDYTSDGAGNGSPKGPERRYVTARWRNERRANGKRLRRETLGY